MKKTAWFPAHIKPVRKGLYQVQSVDRYFSKWDGEHWCRVHRDQDIAERQMHPSWRQDRVWRGLTKETS